MEIGNIRDSIGEGNIITDLYSEKIKCSCGKKLDFSELSFDGLGNSLNCSCGQRLWVFDEEGFEGELLVYEGLDYITDDGFIIVKQKFYAPIDWKRKRLDKVRLRQENEYLLVDLDNNVYISINQLGDSVVIGANEFFKNITLRTMKDIGNQLEEYCSANNIYPNYGTMLKELSNFYNSSNYDQVLKALIDRPYLEFFIKEGLSYLYKDNFIVNIHMLESSVRINKKALSLSEMIGVPKVVINQIREEKMDEYKILLLQRFFIDNNLNDFKTLVSGEKGMFRVQDLDKLKYLLSNGYTSSRLNKYAEEIMREEDLSRESFLNFLVDSVRMSKTGNLEFKPYGRRLVERHNELHARYKIIKNEVIDQQLGNIQNNSTLQQYGDKYIAVIPGSVEAFTEEANNQRHCVLSYAEIMASGETLIVFIRYKDDEGKSYITLEVKNRKIIQAKKFANAGIDQEDQKYLQGLARVNGWIMK
ncbi:PcfJ domain-containing protein [Clostridium sp. C8-1-8]|uniref:PcfJ domain-containing protein n=1 Tax=Clostridium sp. C8-1-8 TaxID=2698831 RepID=UPI00136DE8B4|nr:PcfJ domain-containing protein [Clostridium sp. C8-1-8]